MGGSFYKKKETTTIPQYIVEEKKETLLDRRLGLFLLKDRNKGIPLNDLQFKVEIKDAIGIVELTQVFENDNKEPIECEYRFPINSRTMTLISFTATIDDDVIEGKIMKKDKADEKYSDAIAAGGTAIKIKEGEDNEDVIKVLIGNLLPKQSAVIVIRYIKTLEIFDKS